MYKVPTNVYELNNTCYSDSIDDSLTTEWMTTEEAASYLKLSVGTLRNLASDGKVPYYKLGQRNRYLRKELKQLLLSNRRGVFNGN